MVVSVLVVDDSAFFRGRIIKLLQRNPQIRVVGEAANGRDAVALSESLTPDVITMDYEMPVMDGISAVAEILKRRKLPIVMLSSLTFEGARLTIKALEAGAADFMVKSQMEAMGGQWPVLIEKVLALALHRSEAVRPVREASPPVGRVSSTAAPPLPQPSAPRQEFRKSAVAGMRLLIVAASTGGPVAIRQVLEDVPARFGCPVVIVQHMPERFTQAFAERLSEYCHLKVSEAKDQTVLQPGQAYVAPGGRQLLLQLQGSQLVTHIVTDQDGRLYKPSVDVTLGSAAKNLGAAVLALVLTGMGDDGTRGGRLLHAAGGKIWVQEAASCVVNGMPQSLRNAGLADEVLTLAEMGKRLSQLAG